MIFLVHLHHYLPQLMRRKTKKPTQKDYLYLSAPTEEQKNRKPQKKRKKVCCETSVLLYMYRFLVANWIHAEQLKEKEAVTILLLGLTDACSSSNVHLLLDVAFAWLLEDFCKCTCICINIYFLVAAEIIYIYNILKERWAN